MTSTPILKLRTITRTLGVNRLVASLFSRGAYERRYSEALFEATKPGDCVWDVGANIGYYTVSLSKIVGLKGHIFAFEPSPKNVEKLLLNTEDLHNVTVIPMGLSNKRKELRFLEGPESRGTISRILTDGEDPEVSETKIKVETGDYLIKKEMVRRPNVLKIDTEGHELEVLQGLSHTINEGAVSNLFLEVHFSILQKQNRLSVPRDITQMLESEGFHIDWVDFSHLYAHRRPARL